MALERPSKTYEGLMQKALTLIAKRRYTTMKLKQKLREFHKKQTDLENLPFLSKPELEEALKSVATRLKELKYLNDSEYAKAFVHDRIEFRPKGKFMLKRELKHKGIHPDLAEQTVEEEDINEPEIALKVLTQRAKRLQNETPSKQREKLFRFLSSRGFSVDSIYKAMDAWYNRSELG